jgi:hypothetical protein
MADALLVFSPLQEISFFVLRSPYFDRIGVAPLLRRRLFGLQRLRFSLSSHYTLSAGFSKHVSSLCLLLSLVDLSALRQPLQLAFRLRLQLLPSFQQNVAPYLPLSFLSLRFFNS